MTDSRFNAAVSRFSSINAQDPERVDHAGVPTPKAAAHAARLCQWISKLEPDPSEALRLAAHCQHLERWKYPRADYPEGRRGYLQWRKDCAKAHAQHSSAILEELGFEPPLIEQVKRINLKQGLGQPGDAQTMEDALCLSFLEHEAHSFAGEHEPEKVKTILSKTWGKMSESARAQALRAPLPAPVRQLVERLVSS